MSALHFDSSSTVQYVDLGASAADDDHDPFTAMGWIRLTEAVHAATPYIWAISDNTEFLLRDAGGGNGFMMWRAMDGSPNESLAFVNSVLSTNTWYFLAGVFDTGATNDFELYRGSLTSAVAQESATYTNGGGTPTADTGQSRVGNRSYATPTDAFGMRGDIARLALYSAAFTTAQLEEFRVSPELWMHHPDLVTLQIFGYGEVASGSTDFGHNGLDGTSTGSPTLTDEPPLALPWDHGHAWWVNAPSVKNFYSGGNAMNRAHRGLGWAP